MPLDPRIPLMGASWQAPDILGAMRQGQEYRQNQMAQQAARETAQRNAMARQRAASVDPTNRPAVNAFVREVGADVAAPYLEAWNNVGGMFRADAEEARARGKYAREARTEDRDFMQGLLAAAYNDPSDENIAAVRAQAIAAGIPEADFDAYAARFLAAPVEQRRALLTNELATTDEGRSLLTTFAPKWEREDRGGTIDTIQVNPLAPGAAPPPRAVTTPDPRAPQIIQTAEGFGSVVPGQPGFTPVVGVGGSPVMPYNRSEAGAGDDAKTNAAEGLRSTLESLRGYYAALDESGGIVSTERGAGRNIAASAAASLPGRVIGRTLGSEDQTQRDNIRTAIPMIVASLKDLTGMSAQQMNSNVELQLFLNTVGDPSQSIETVNEALDRFERYVARVAGEAQGAGSGGSPQRIWDRYGVPYVVRDGQWVPE